MHFIEDIRIGKERTQAGLGAEIDRPASILGAGEIDRVGILEDPSAESDKARRFMRINGLLRHILLLLRLHFGDEDFKRIDRQPIGRLGRL